MAHHFDSATSKQCLKHYEPSKKNSTKVYHIVRYLFPKPDTCNYVKNGENISTIRAITASMKEHPISQYLSHRTDIRDIPASISTHYDSGTKFQRQEGDQIVVKALL
jgi:hypothetical protein